MFSDFWVRKTSGDFFPPLFLLTLGEALFILYFSHISDQSMKEFGLYDYLKCETKQKQIVRKPKVSVLTGTNKFKSTLMNKYYYHLI